MTLVKVILGSTRPNRFGIQPAQWLMDVAKEVTEATFELVDLQEVNLPLLDEPIPPSQHKYTQDHTKKWSSMIDEADGFVFVTAEYNHSVPAALKNALDYLFVEWQYKPASFVSYGSAAGGTRAVEHLRGICGEVKMYDLRDQLVLASFRQHQDEHGNYQFTDQQQEQALSILKQTAFWAERLKPIREELLRQSA